MNRIIGCLTLLAALLFSIGAVAQEKIVNPEISYAGTPRSGVIGGIAVSGVEGYEDYMLTGISGLTVGQKIELPGQEITEAAKKSQTEPVYYITDKKNAGFVRLDFNYGKSNADINVVGIETKENASIDVYMDFNGDKDGEGFAAVQTRLYAAKDSVIRLIQIQRVGSETTFINDIGGYCEDGARIELVQLYLSGKNRYEGCEIKLAGDGSSMSAEIGYVAAGKERLDMNYCVRHIGKKTECAINAAGALRDTAFKLFRGTIDFIKGSAGSVGNEKEEVLLIDEKCVNQTIPIILCAEEDVVGNHGATIGKPDEELLFYLESRGIPAQECYNMLAAAKLLAVCGKIPDDGIRNEIHDYIKEVY